ncbi:hypothetical protein SEA_WYBORN_56 [Arthrobacter phage Wyborn]|uniref:Uncharacterized protein n=1 Tax=Arthrobacter phage Wyborn TaxID=3059067 RepID=A0AA96K550_9CAUD|nr:hypothetical protein SEA_WYBORN_56 [Arthrobacter phage Wyborn]
MYVLPGHPANCSCGACAFQRAMRVRPERITVSDLMQGDVVEIRHRVAEIELVIPQPTGDVEVFWNFRRSDGKRDPQASTFTGTTSFEKSKRA